MVNNLSEKIGTKTACDVFGLPRSTYYYQLEPEVQVDFPSKRKSPNFAYSQQEKQEILNIMNSDIYLDQTPYEIYASQLDEGNYLCS
ncbi:MAG: putative transposase, partial [Candidatus Cloacimonadota bacterium]|nr:putative transposase [Candidatus Cloacimonadota bacterium]